MFKFKEARSFVFFILSILVLFSAMMLVTWATSVGTNVDVTGTFTANGNGTFGDAATDTYLFTGILRASSTLTVTGVTNLYANFFINGRATTTAATGNTLLNGTLGVATTTISSGADLGVDSSATTTISLGSSSGTQGGCIELQGIDGVQYKVFAAATTSVTKQLVVEAGNCDKVDGGN